MQRILHELSYVGVLAVEFFAMGDHFLANEMAPREAQLRPLDDRGGGGSGQFENHLRAIRGLPLGGDADMRGGFRCQSQRHRQGCPDLAALLAVDGAHVHLYGKEAAPGRKLGHVTVRGATHAAIAGRVAKVRAIVEGWRCSNASRSTRRGSGRRVLGWTQRGSRLGAKGLVLLPSLDRLVAWLSVYTRERSLEDLLPSLQINLVRSKLGTREIALELAAESSDRMDRIADVARLVGGFTFTGTSRHFVQYRDLAAPFGYDALDLLATDAQLALYHGAIHAALRRRARCRAASTPPAPDAAGRPVDG